MTTTAFDLRARVRSASGLLTGYWLLRVGAALCFIGHGAFGFITKEAWLPYFAVAGIPPEWGYRLMPVVGALDVVAGMAVLFAPRTLPLGYMVVWALWTALLRPLSGEPIWEAVERAGNYGVPLALVMLTGMPRTGSDWLLLRDRPLQSASVLDLTLRILRWTTAALLLGHGALGIMAKPGLSAHYAAIGLPTGVTPWIGGFEIGLAIAVAARPAIGLLLFVAAWKLATESLWSVAGAPVWEFVERAGSYAAPLALAALATTPRTVLPSGSRSGERSC